MSTRGPAPVAEQDWPRQGADLDELREIAVRVATEAAALVRQRRHGRVEVAATKSTDTDIVTEVDHEAEALLRSRLAELRPEDAFLGEESAADPISPAGAEPGAPGGSGDQGSAGITWVVDPVDGTVNYLYNLGHCAVSVAAVDGTGESVAGAVVDVTNGEVYSAARGAGATLNGRRLQVREPVPMGERLVLTGFQYQVRVRERQGPAVARLLTQVRDVRRLGSAALDLCMVARGSADAYVEEGLQLWDRAAAGLIAEEAGARAEVHPGASGMDCMVAAPAATYDELLSLFSTCGFLA